MKEKRRNSWNRKPFLNLGLVHDIFYSHFEIEIAFSPMVRILADNGKVADIGVEYWVPPLSEQSFLSPST